VKIHSLSLLTLEEKRRCRSILVERPPCRGEPKEGVHSMSLAPLQNKRESVALAKSIKKTRSVPSVSQTPEETERQVSKIMPSASDEREKG